MSTLSGWMRGPWLVALLVVSVAEPESMAGGSKGGRGGRAPRHAAPRRSNTPRPQAYRMPRSSASVSSARPNITNNHAANVRANANGLNARNLTGSTRPVGTNNGISTVRPNSYTYGTGTGSRSYHAYGYGHGYRNRSSGSGYGRSQGSSRALVSRLRSVHSSLARIDHDYRGHRARAMHSISMAVRQLSHRSSSNSGSGLANRSNTGANRNLATARNGANNGVRQNARLTQAQSDGRMSQALRTTQGIQMQLSNQGTSSAGHAGARRHVALAVREMHTALAVR